MNAKPRVLIIYTGGTIGMIKNPSTGKLNSVNFNHVYDHVPELKRINAELQSISFEMPIDSSEINITHWQSIATTIFDNYNDYDGFVVLHGSDTMAYTASALSYMLDGLKKPVILTGAQLPIGIIRTDGKENLITAIEIAAERNDDGTPVIQEVAVYFDYYLFRGNRSMKDSAENFEAFRSPNYRELVSAGVGLNYHHDLFYKTESEKLTLRTGFNTDVMLIKLYPAIDFTIYQEVLRNNRIKGLIIESFGAGNGPSDPVFKDLLSEFINQGGIVLNITQCNSGKVEMGVYESSTVFTSVGAISGSDMTTEAAVTKMMFLLGNYSIVETKRLLPISLRGELTQQ